MLLNPVTVDGKPYRIEMFNQTLYVSPLRENGDEIDCTAVVLDDPSVFNRLRDAVNKAAGDLLGKMDIV